MNKARSRVMPRCSNVYPVHFHRGLVPLHETIDEFRIHQNVHGVVGQGLDYQGGGGIMFNDPVFLMPQYFECKQADIE